MTGIATETRFQNDLKIIQTQHQFSAVSNPLKSKAQENIPAYGDVGRCAFSMISSALPRLSYVLFPYNAS